MIDYATLKEKTEKVFMLKCPHCLDLAIQMCNAGEVKGQEERRQIKCLSCKAASPVCKDELSVKMMWVQLFYQIHDRWM